MDSATHHSLAPSVFAWIASCRRNAGNNTNGKRLGATATPQHTQVTHAATCSAHRRATVKQRTC